MIWKVLSVVLYAVSVLLGLLEDVAFWVWGTICDVQIDICNLINEFRQRGEAKE